MTEHPTGNGQPKPNLAGRKILVVEDDRLNARIITSILKPEGFVTTEAHSAEKALELFTTFQPDLVLLDIVLPGMDGIEACRRIKRDLGGSAIPVIFITALNKPEDVVAGLTAGGVDYVVKPFQAKETLARIRTHMSLRVLMEQHVALIDDLSRANAAKNHFLGIAAHDLRNPLTSIRGLSEFLMEDTTGPLNEDQRAMLQSMHSATQVMLDLLNELLDISIIESGETRLDCVPCNLVDIVGDAVALSSIQASKKEMRFDFKRGTLTQALMLDTRKFRQVVDNLLSNAIKFSPRGSTITVEVSEDSGHQIVSVRDQGRGIPKGEMGKLFQSFGRTSVRPTGGEKSTGLGLAICRKIVEAHGGKITADNLEDGGADFRVTFKTTHHGI
jgi:two-component system sensor histidine kinase/response regulator